MKWIVHVVHVRRLAVRLILFWKRGYWWNIVADKRSCFRCASKGQACSRSHQISIIRTRCHGPEVNTREPLRRQTWRKDRVDEGGRGRRTVGSREASAASTETLRLGDMVSFAHWWWSSLDGANIVWYFRRTGVHWGRRRGFARINMRHIYVGQIRSALRIHVAQN